MKILTSMMKIIFSIASSKLISILNQNIGMQEKVSGNNMNNTSTRLLSVMLNINKLFIRYLYVLRMIF